MDEAVINHLKRTYNLLIGEPRAEQVKIQIGSAAPLDEELTMEIAGRDTISGLPRKIVITSEEIREALQEPIRQSSTRSRPRWRRPSRNWRPT